MDILLGNITYMYYTADVLYSMLLLCLHSYLFSLYKFAQWLFPPSRD